MKIRPVHCTGDLMAADFHMSTLSSLSNIELLELSGNVDGNIGIEESLERSVSISNEDTVMKRPPCELSASNRFGRGNITASTRNIGTRNTNMRFDKLYANLSNQQPSQVIRPPSYARPLRALRTGPRLEFWPYSRLHRLRERGRAMQTWNIWIGRSQKRTMKSLK